MKETAHNNLIAVCFENLLPEFLPHHSKFAEQFLSSWLIKLTKTVVLLIVHVE